MKILKEIAPLYSRIKMPLDKTKAPVNKALYEEMLTTYCNEKRLDLSKSIDEKDFKTWWDEKCVFDNRTPQQKKSGKGNLMKLTDVLKMTQEEADRLGVGVHRKAWLELDARKSASQDPGR